LVQLFETANICWAPYQKVKLYETLISSVRNLLLLYLYFEELRIPNVISYILFNAIKRYIF